MKKEIEDIVFEDSLMSQQQIELSKSYIQMAINLNSQDVSPLTLLCYKCFTAGFHLSSIGISGNKGAWHEFYKNIQDQILKFETNVEHS